VPGSLEHVLDRARALGLLGPGPIEAHLAHTTAFERAVPVPPQRLLDLGSGAGVPGLILARHWPDTAVVLLESQARRGEFLDGAVAELGVEDQVTVVVARAELAGRDPSLREGFDLVTARGFGKPATTAECGRAFCAPGGLLLVSEPPDAPDARWPAAGLATLRFQDEGVHAEATGRVRRLRAVGPCPEDVPRRDGIPASRPRF
jgi:16S rRNA (guanine527-N7)-methyltransferase